MALLEWPQHLASSRSARPGFPNCSQVNAPLGGHPPQHRPTPNATPAAWALSTVLPARPFGQVRSRAGNPTPGMIHPQARLPWSAARRAEMSPTVFLTFQAPSGEALPFGPSSSSTKLTLLSPTTYTFRPAQDRQEMEGKKEGKWPGKKVHSLPGVILRWGPGRHLFFRLIWLSLTSLPFPSPPFSRTPPTHPSAGIPQPSAFQLAPRNCVERPQLAGTHPTLCFSIITIISHHLRICRALYQNRSFIQSLCLVFWPLLLTSHISRRAAVQDYPQRGSKTLKSESSLSRSMRRGADSSCHLAWTI